MAKHRPTRPRADAISRSEIAKLAAGRAHTGHGSLGSLPLREPEQRAALRRARSGAGLSNKGKGQHTALESLYEEDNLKDEKSIS